MELKNTLVIAVICLFFCSSLSQELNSKGKNVCKLPGSAELMCCSGWGPLGDECLTPLCEGNFTCKENEVCVRPNECRCRHGYFGASCDTKCPSQFWGPDCKGKCTCFPNGQCDDVTGKCTCNHNRWGPNCENACVCQNGRCDQATGRCACHPGFFGAACAGTCYCSVNSACDQANGRCLCHPGWYGRNCANPCGCNNSPCEQYTGRCLCRERLWGPRCERYCQCGQGKCNPNDGSCSCSPGYRGKLCREPCPAGSYGQNCRNKCGHCKGQQPCKVTEGRCVTCETGWNGTKCDQKCLPGFFGDSCQDTCPPCKDGHFCNHVDGKCSHCNPGWIGDSCDLRCPNGTYGENCENDCSHCFNGACHVETGECLCDPGFRGTYCNMTCEPGHHGVNCAHACSCHDNTCDSVSGACYLQPNQRVGVMAAGGLVGSLLLLLLGLLCCCCLCRHKHQHNKKAKRILCGRFSRISTKLPRIPLRRQKLPKVVVAHHDPENAFNCSFIDPPSAAEQPSSWSSQGSFSSFESAEDGPVYCVPHEESPSENRDKGSPQPAPENPPTSTDEDAGEYTSLKDTSSLKPGNPAADTAEQPPIRSSDSEGSTSGSESTRAVLYARISRLSKHSREDEGEGAGSASPAASDVRGNAKPPPSPGKPKPRPPDPSTKPKVSWIHGNNATGSPQPEPHGARGPTAPKEKRTSSDCSAPSEERERTRAKEPPGEERSHEANGSPGKPKTPRGKPGGEQAPANHLEHINGVVQNALKKISNFHSSPEKKAAAVECPKDPPRSPTVIHPHMNSEAATLLAAQLKEKTQSINRNEGTGLAKTPNGLPSPQAQREKPTPPQKAKRGSTPAQHGHAKPLLPTTSSLHKMLAPVCHLGSPDPQSPEKQDLDGSRTTTEAPAEAAAGGATPRKTPIKKPPRKKGKEGTGEAGETRPPQPKTAMMPPQTVKQTL